MSLAEIDTYNSKDRCLDGGMEYEAHTENRYDDS
jgi:hypothetical protein